MIKLEGHEYLVLMELDEESVPKICLYKIPKDSEQIDGKPSYVIPRAELLIDCDKDDNIRFLTNSINLGADNFKDLEFSRL